MVLNRKAQQRFNVQTMWMILLILHHCPRRSHAASFRPSAVEITPDLVVVNPNTNLKFLCHNHQSNDSVLEVKLSKNISSTDIQLSTTVMNGSTMEIQLVVNDYVGLFHLFCYVQGKLHEGTRSDVIVKAMPGVLQLVERCQVFDRQYIKCMIQASKIARAVMNDYPLKFQFQEINQDAQLLVYNPHFEFSRSESSDELLVFKWKPMVDGVFPDGLRMRMKVTGPYFNTSIYQFDMTPIFRITPKFQLRLVASNEIAVELSINAESYSCEDRFQEKLNPSFNETRIMISHYQNRYVVGNLRSNTMYLICLKCRQSISDPYGEEKCEEIKTGTRFMMMNTAAWNKLSLLLAALVLFALLIGILLICHFSRRTKSERSLKLRFRISNDYHDHGTKFKTLDASGPADPSDSLLDRSRTNTDVQSESYSYNAEEDEYDHGPVYLPIASPEDVFSRTFPSEVPPADKTEP